MLDYLHISVADNIDSYREEEMAEEIMESVRKNGLPSDSISDKGFEIQFNPSSGCVFLVNEDYQCWMMNGDELETWYNCPECGNEGFKEDILEYHKDCCIDHFGWKSEVKLKMIEEIQK